LHFVGVTLRLGHGAWDSRRIEGHRHQQGQCVRRFLAGWRREVPTRLAARGLDDGQVGDHPAARAFVAADLPAQHGHLGHRIHEGDSLGAFGHPRRDGGNRRAVGGRRDLEVLWNDSQGLLS